MPVIVDIPQNTEEWKLWRRSKIGASDIATIITMSPWQTPLQLFEEKVFGKERAPSRAMMRGTRLEGEVRKMLNEYFNINYEPKVLQSDEFDWAIASLDGYFQDGNDIYTAEIKVPNEKTVMDSAFGIIPDHYRVQCQWQIYVSGAKHHVYVTGKVGKNEKGEECIKEIYPVVVERNEERIEYLKSSAMHFKRRLDEFDPPEALDRDVVIINDQKAQELVIECHDLAKSIKSRQVILDMKKEELKKILKHPRCDVGDYRVTTSYRSGSVDYSKIPELQLVDLKKYRKTPSSFMTIRMKKEASL